MNILLLTTHLDYGGISSYTVSLAHSLSVQGHTVICASGGGQMRARLAECNIRHVLIPIRVKLELHPAVLVSFLKLLFVMRHEHIDVIHAQTRVTQVLAAMLSAVLKIPYVTTCHGFFRMNLGRQLFPSWGKKVIAISGAVKKHLMIDFYVPEKTIALIPNGIEVNQFKISPKRLDPHIPARTVGIIARLSSVKGHEYLLEAMRAVIAEYHDARLFIFGEGRIKNALVRKAEQLKITEHVFFLPAVSNSSQVLHEIDIFAMPSLQEGLGLSILEAQASGVPVVATNVGGIPTIVRHGLTGLLVPAKDPGALAGAIMKLMDNKETAIALSRRARQDVEEEFSLEKMAQKVTAVYQQAGTPS